MQVGLEALLHEGLLLGGEHDARGYQDGVVRAARELERLVEALDDGAVGRLRRGRLKALQPRVQQEVLRRGTL